MIVVDTNVLAARNLTTGLTSLAECVEERDAVWIVPPLWRYEFQNILTKTLRARQLVLNDAMAAWTRAVDQVGTNEHEPSPARVIEITNNYRITAYDANFIALAMEMGVLCVTEDVELQQKFPAIAVSMASFLDRNRSFGEVREPRAPYRTHAKAKRKTTPCR